jgi:phenylpyruvate tautomerase PptA (4-oxalocrotonate tautomerase family)
LSEFRRMLKEYEIPSPRVTEQWRSQNFKGEICMPFVKVEIFAGKSKEYKKKLLDSIHSALVESFKIPDDDRIQRLYEIEPDNFETVPGKTDKYTLIELTVFKGRSVEAKRKLYSTIVEKLNESLNIDGSDILIAINELPLENWGVRGGKAAIDIDFGFKIDV